jgi:hypothetical protein
MFRLKTPEIDLHPLVVKLRRGSEKVTTWKKQTKK